ncbi:mlp/crp family protein 1 [Aphelenchoides avenae]|nr:mlp/crp family protein 1 [Aphelenchus avenae]
MPFVPAATPKCPKCEKSVYAAEQILAGGNAWHKVCFKCKMCNKALDSTLCCEAEGGKELYCKTCYGRKYGPKGFRTASSSNTITMDKGEAYGNKGSKDKDHAAEAFVAPTK